MKSTNDTAGLGDDQGTRVGAPDQSSASPAKHADSPPARPERSTGVGGEAALATDGEAEGHTTEHRSGYGGAGGDPVKPSDSRK
jgi:hypothetical protein